MQGAEASVRAVKDAAGEDVVLDRGGGQGSSNGAAGGAELG